MQSTEDRRACQPREGYPLECEVVGGLEDLACEDVRRVLGDRASVASVGRGLFWLRLHGDLGTALALRLVTAVSLIESFPVPRPRALLGDQHIRALRGAIDLVRGLHPPGAFASFRLAGAGSDSAVFARLAEAIADHTGLPSDPDEADLLIRIRPAVAFRDGWEAVVRLTPRPLSARAWRVRNYPGALHAPVAAAVVELTRPHPSDRFLNALCGSGTLLIERLLRMSAALAVGCDTNGASLAAAEQNLRAAGLAGKATLLDADATALPWADASFDVLCADLPWGQLVGSHEDNRHLYPALLAELTRLAAPGARLALVTQQPRLLEDVLAAEASQWRPVDTLHLAHASTYPRIYLLQRWPG